MSADDCCCGCFGVFICVSCLATLCNRGLCDGCPSLRCCNGFCLKNYFRNHDFEDNVVREAELFREQEQEGQKQTLKKQPKASPPMDSGIQMDTLTQLGPNAANLRLDPSPSTSSRGPEAMHKRSASSQSAFAGAQRESLAVRPNSPSVPLNVADSDMNRHRRSTSRELPMPPFETPPPLA